MNKEEVLLSALIEMLKEFDSADNIGAVLLFTPKAVEQAREAYKIATGKEWNPMNGNHAPEWYKSG